MLSKTLGYAPDLRNFKTLESYTNTICAMHAACSQLQLAYLPESIWCCHVWLGQAKDLRPQKWSISLSSPLERENLVSVYEYIEAFDNLMILGRKIS